MRGDASLGLGKIWSINFIALAVFHPEKPRLMTSKRRRQPSTSRLGLLYNAESGRTHGSEAPIEARSRRASRPSAVSVSRQAERPGDTETEGGQGQRVSGARQEGVY